MRATAGLRTAGAQAAGRAGDIGGGPGDVAGAVRWLVSDEAAWGQGRICWWTAYEVRAAAGTLVRRPRGAEIYQFAGA